MSGKSRKSLRQSFNDRARRATAAAAAALALFSCTYVDAATSYAKAEATVSAVPAAPPAI